MRIYVYILFYFTKLLGYTTNKTIIKYGNDFIPAGCFFVCSYGRFNPPSSRHPTITRRACRTRPDRLAPPYTTRRGILFKTLGLAPVISSSHSLSRVPLYLLYPLEQPLGSPIHRRASSDPQRGISRILKWRLISGQFHLVTQLSSHHFRFPRRGEGIAWLFLVEIIKPSKGGRRLIRIKGSISP